LLVHMSSGRAFRGAGPKRKTRSRLEQF
jgi:hypothetical protein